VVWARCGCRAGSECGGPHVHTWRSPVQRCTAAVAVCCVCVCVGVCCFVCCRQYSARDEARCECDTLRDVLEALPGARRMVVGGCGGGGARAQRCGVSLAARGGAGTTAWAAPHTTTRCTSCQRVCPPPRPPSRVLVRTARVVLQVGHTIQDRGINEACGGQVSRSAARRHGGRHAAGTRAGTCAPWPARQRAADTRVHSCSDARTPVARTKHTHTHAHTHTHTHTHTPGPARGRGAVQGLRQWRGAGAGDSGRRAAGAAAAGEPGASGAVVVTASGSSSSSSSRTSAAAEQGRARAPCRNRSTHSSVASAQLAARAPRMLLAVRVPGQAGCVCVCACRVSCVARVAVVIARRRRRRPGCGRATSLVCECVDHVTFAWPSSCRAAEMEAVVGHCVPQPPLLFSSGGGVMSTCCHQAHAGLRSGRCRNFRSSRACTAALGQGAALHDLPL
jgi:hypothetical protein